MTKAWAVLGALLLLLGAALGWAARTQARYVGHIREADQAFASGDFEQALRRYQAAQAEYTRGALWLRRPPWRRGGEPDRLLLQLGNARYRRAESLLTRYVRARRDPEIAERPSLESVHEQFAEARRLYEQVPRIDPVTYSKAQFNAAHAAAMDFLLDIWDDKPKSQAALRGDLVRLIRRVSGVLDYVNAEHVALSREDRMRPVLLLERLTQFSQEPKRFDDRAEGSKKLGDYLRVAPPRMTDAERKLLEKFLLNREDPVQPGAGRQGGVH